MENGILEVAAGLYWKTVRCRDTAHGGQYFCTFRQRLDGGRTARNISINRGK